MGAIVETGCSRKRLHMGMEIVWIRQLTPWEVLSVVLSIIRWIWFVLQNRSFQASDKVQGAFEDPARGRRVQMKPRLPAPNLPAGPGEGLKPLTMAPVDSRDRNPMPLVADPVHEAQGRGGEPPLPKMVLDDYGPSGHAAPLNQEAQGLSCMVEHVREEGDIETAIGSWDRAAVKGAGRDSRLRPQVHFEPFDVQVGTSSAQFIREPAVPGPHIQDRAALGDERREVASQNAHPAGRHIAFVEPIEKAHVRRMPRMLTKKLDSAV